MLYAKAQNVSSASSNVNKISSAIQLYEKLTGDIPSICRKYGCKNKNNLEGGHVMLYKNNGESLSDEWVIIPICSSCNKIANSEKYTVKNGKCFSHTKKQVYSYTNDNFTLI